MITILNEVVQMPEKACSMIVICAVFIIISLVIAGYCIYGIYDILTDRCKVLESWIAFSILYVILAGLSVGVYFLGKGIVSRINERETIVYATIDDTVPWITVNERYELIRQDGQIYQLKLKEKQ